MKLLSILLLAAVPVAAQPAPSPQPHIDVQVFAQAVVDKSEIKRRVADDVRRAVEDIKRSVERDFRYGRKDSYQDGARALDSRDYDRAVQSFDRVIVARSARAEGAYYWKAYALNKLGKRDEAVAALGELVKHFPQSRWLNDAKALTAEVKQATGQGVSPESQNDEDLKLYAINALVNSDPERAVPLLDKLLGEAKTSPRLKERALFVLAQSRTDQARAITHFTPQPISRAAADPRRKFLARHVLRNTY